MGKILDNYIKTNVRFQYGDLILYEPSDEQIKELKDIISKNVTENKEFEIEGSLNFDTIKTIIRDLTSIGYEIDDYTDGDIINLYNNGKKPLRKLIDAISELIQELTEELFEEQLNQVKFINSYVNIINGEKDINKMKDKINKLFKKNKINMSFDDIISIHNEKGMNKEKIEDLINTIKK